MNKIAILQMIARHQITKYPELPPISQGTGAWTCMAAKEKILRINSDAQTLDVMHMLEENPHTSSRQKALALNISHSSILRVLIENRMYPYKVHCSKIMLYRRWQTCIQVKETHNFHDLADLRRSITVAITSITPQMLTNFPRSQRFDRHAWLKHEKVDVMIAT
ncbi:hypothetical protein NQ318_004656 [Aromia moschata]|uniref:Transposase n=1 Tax=Aromia moschata TaxID=1265417 RepID=A0AAV8Y606_9CUCU|nr:hypothetical protein NQ318_004656 [Aromia moschata]